MPIAGYATLTENDAIELTALVGSMDGSVLLKETVVGTDPEKVGLEAAMFNKTRRKRTYSCCK